MSEDINRGAGQSGGGERVGVVPLEAGTEVCVWNHYFDRWTGGFAVAGVEKTGYRVARLSDGHVFEDVFAFADVIPERRKAQVPGILGTDHDRRREEATGAPVGHGRGGEPFRR